MQIVFSMRPFPFSTFILPHLPPPVSPRLPPSQVTSIEAGPCICVWDSRTGSQPDGPAAASEVTRLEFDKEARGFCALGFSPSGTRLAAVAMDNYHTVYVYDWRKKRELCSGRGQMGDPPQVGGGEGAGQRGYSRGVLAGTDRGY